MKLKTTLMFGVLALAAGNASAAVKVFNISGATAFRASMNNAIISVLGGEGVTKYAYTGTQGIAGSNRAIFVGTLAAFPGDTIIVRTEQNGSTAGVRNVEDNTPITYLSTNVREDGTPGPGNPVTTAGYNLGGAGLDAPETETAIPQWAFSDVDKLLSDRPNATLNGLPVGVVPFMFLAGEGAPVALNNMTDQLHRTLWSTGQVPISFFTGDTNDATTVLATGRNNGSGTRATILAETEYGAFTNVQQFNASFTGTRTDSFPTGALLTLSSFGNGGHPSNSGVRELLTRSSQNLKSSGGSPIDAIFVSYLTISDALSALTEGAQEMTYNGVAFSPVNVKNGLYSLWGYQQFYIDDDATADELIFDAAVRPLIPATLDGVDGIQIGDMNVTRSGGDGGPISPNDVEEE